MRSRLDKYSNRNAVLSHGTIKHKIEIFTFLCQFFQMIRSITFFLSSKGKGKCQNSEKMLKIGNAAVLNQWRQLRARGPFDRMFFDISELL